MLKHIIVSAILAISSIPAQNTCWHPIGPTAPEDQAFALCHAFAVPGNTGWTHRFDPSQMTPQMLALVKAIAMVEQGLTSPDQIDPGKANAVGDNGAARGPLQLHLGAFLDSLQRQPKIAPGPAAYPQHVEGHCWDPSQPELEKEMHRQLWWANSVGVWYEYGLRYSYHDMLNMGAAGAERIARRWNGGGPNGAEKDATIPYWNKVKAKLQAHFPGVIPGI